MKTYSHCHWKLNNCKFINQSAIPFVKVFPPQMLSSSWEGAIVQAVPIAFAPVLKIAQKMWFFGLFRAKMTKIGIQNPKLIVTNDYQQFLAYFEWFLALFQISDVKPELL